MKQNYPFNKAAEPNLLKTSFFESSFFESSLHVTKLAEKEKPWIDQFFAFFNQTMANK
jgi:hypothetical protein